MKKQVEIISGDYLPTFQKKCNDFLITLDPTNVVDTQFFMVIGCFYLKVEYLTVN